MKPFARRVRLLALLTVAAATMMTMFVGGGTAHAATTTKLLDRHCRTTASGTACAEVWQVTSGKTVTRKGRLTLKPAKGHWMQPVDYNAYGIQLGESGPYCGTFDAPKACAKHKTAWTSPWVAEAKNWAYGGTYNTDAKSAKGGAYGIDAGDTGNWQLSVKCGTDTHGKACVRLYQRVNRGKATLTARLGVAPKAHSSITPGSVTVVVQAKGHAAVTKKVNFCSSGCTRRTKSWTGSATVNGPTTYPWVVMKAVGVYTSAAKHTLTASF